MAAVSANCVTVAGSPLVTSRTKLIASFQLGGLEQGDEPGSLRPCVILEKRSCSSCIRNLAGELFSNYWRATVRQYDDLNGTLRLCQSADSSPDRELRRKKNLYKERIAICSASSKRLRVASRKRPNKNSSAILRRTAWSSIFNRMNGYAIAAISSAGTSS